MKTIRTGIVALVFVALPAFASGISYDCATTGSAAIPTNVCSILNTTVSGEYAAIFTDANSYIYIQYASSGNDVANNVQIYNTVSYAAYYDALAANASGPNDAAAVGSLGGSLANPVISGQGVALTSSLDQALGFSAQSYGITASETSCSTIGSASNPNGCYNDVISVSSDVSFYFDGITAGSQTSSEFDFFSAVEHETDEALGTSSCLANGAGTESGGCDNGANPNNPAEPCYYSRHGCSFPNFQGTSAADLFRYASPDVRSYSGYDGTTDGSTAYFSINGGATPIAYYNNTTNGSADYGDWSTTCTYVQDAYGCSGGGAGLNIENDGGVEIAVLDAVGYNLTPEGEALTAGVAPEPGTVGMLALGLGTMAWFARRRRHPARLPQSLSSGSCRNLGSA